MATPFPIVTAAQVGTYFVGQYYQVLKQQPEFVHQFYSDASTVVRIDGNSRETATAMLQIHSLIMSMSFTGFEIKAAQALESWNRGVLVMVSGCVQIKNYCGIRKFAQTFFLAPQEKGYFVLNDIFYFIVEEPFQHHAPFLPQTHLDSRLIPSATMPEPVSKYLVNGEVLAREFLASVSPKENGLANGYGVPEQSLDQSPVSETIIENNFGEETNRSLQNTVNVLQDHQLASVEEPVGEPQKHTYASILRVAKGQSAPVVASSPPVNKSSPPASEWNHVPQPTSQEPVVSSNVVDSSGADNVYESSAVEDDGDIKSVYVRNVPPTVSEFEIEEEFKKFGKIRPEGVAIRSRKDLGVCYAFVEFEDMTGVENAIKAGSAEVSGRRLYIEERRSNSSIPFRGGRGRGGRGRGSYYQGDAGRGRFGARNFGSGNGQGGVARDYGRPRGNGIYRPVVRQNGSFSGHHVSD